MWIRIADRIVNLDEVEDIEVEPLIVHTDCPDQWCLIINYKSGRSKNVLIKETREQILLAVTDIFGEIKVIR